VLVDERTKAITAILDGPEITRWKTAADSALAARKLSRENSKVLLVLGAGPIARALTEAYLHIRPSVREVLLWNRTSSKLAEACSSLNTNGVTARIVSDLDASSAKADIIVAATSATAPLIRSNYIRPGTHLDLVGSFQPDMREAESEILRNARIFVDDRESAYATGEIAIALSHNIIDHRQIEGDLFDLCQRSRFVRNPTDITVFKNAGGAHFDLMVSLHVAESLRRRTEIVEEGLPINMGAEQ
jgi:ornithine cyclodeaminase